MERFTRAFTRLPKQLLGHELGMPELTWQNAQVLIPWVFVLTIFIAPVATRRWKHTWFHRRFSPHRILGMTFLLQYGLLWHLFNTSSDAQYQAAWGRPIALALNGMGCCVTAILLFKFLPNAMDPGYFSDKGTVSRLFVIENLFFQSMVVFGSAYYNDMVYQNFFQGNILGRIVEAVYVFVPYVVLRPLVPTTRFSTAMAVTKTKTSHNIDFYYYGTLMIKIFYLWSKHFMGGFINFARFLNLITPAQMHWVRGMWLLNAGTVSIAVFLHTMRFKRLLPPRLTFTIYVFMAYGLLPLLQAQWQLACVAAGLMAVNFQRDPLALKVAYVASGALLAYIHYFNQPHETLCVLFLVPCVLYIAVKRSLAMLRPKTVAEADATPATAAPSGDAAAQEEQKSVTE